MTPAPRLRDLLLGAALALAGLHLPGCVNGKLTPAGKAVEVTLTKLGCALAGIFSHEERVGTLCDDIAPEVEAEIEAAVADRDVKPGNLLLGHRTKKHPRPVRLAEHVQGRDPKDGETIDAEYLPHVQRVIARRNAATVAAMPLRDGGGR